MAINVWELDGDINNMSTIKSNSEDLNLDAAGVGNKVNFQHNGVTQFTSADMPISVIAFGADPTGGVDSTAAIQASIDAAKAASKATYFPSGNYLVQSTVELPTNGSIIGEGKKNVTLICTSGHDGAVIELPGSSRTCQSGFSIVTNSKYGIKLDTVSGTKYPFMTQIGNIEVVSTCSGPAATSTLAEIEMGPACISIEGASHVGMSSVNTSGKNIGCLLSADTFNTGVMTFNNCFFGHKEQDNIGFFFGTGAALDSYTFNSCFFAGVLAGEQIGIGNNNVTQVVHVACHYESKGTLSNSALVSLEGGPGLGAKAVSFINCIFGGHSVCRNGVRFSDVGCFFGISFIYPTFHAIKKTGYAFEMGAGTLFRDCTIDGYQITTTAPTPFNNEASLFKETGNWFGGFMVRREGTFETFKALEVGDHCRLSSAATDSEFSYQYTTGDTFLNSTVSDVGQFSNAGWIATGEGGSEVMKPFGMVREKPSITAPKTGTYNRGAIVYNTAPAPGTNIGWVCVAAGTPGTWKAFGAIEE